jgi:hypothetical protein
MPERDRRCGMFPSRGLDRKIRLLGNGANLFYCQLFEAYADRNSGLIGVVSIDADGTMISVAEHQVMFARMCVCADRDALGET